ncbi:hypothetical protein EVAR_7222_1 [Eumeta japonica]|uniref:Uncharacterized protein n=1 Tax=Eumeta variegata TaxID=151549 RepID=A0A4C1T3A0_EUMVA|nr:hypothetical protein EVAR_7222_1 [Eumeta japonica]
MQRSRWVWGEAESVRNRPSPYSLSVRSAAHRKGAACTEADVIAAPPASAAGVRASLASSPRSASPRNFHLLNETLATAAPSTFIVIAGAAPPRVSRGYN